MPPPHFSSIAQGGANAAAMASAAGANSKEVQLSDLPKPQRNLVRDAIQHIRATLASDGEHKSSTANRTSPAAYDAIRKLVDDPALQAVEAHSSMSGRSKAQASTNGSGSGQAGDASNANANTAISEAESLRKHVGSVVNTTLYDIFSDEMDQDSRPHTQLLVSYLHALHPILDPMCVVLEWWDVLLRPALKNPHCNPSIARKAHSLVVWSMRSTPNSAYVDEPAPSPVWPNAPQSASVEATDPTVRTSRKPGDAPYPSASTRSVSLSRSSEDGGARRLALFAIKSSSAKDMEPLRRFTQRVFDLYTSEASATSTRGIEDEDLKDIEADESGEEGTDGTGDDARQDGDAEAKNARHGEQEHHRREERGRNPNVVGAKQNDDSLISSTWKGNLEAIILTFGEQRPKAFFHHLSESFLEPASRIPILLLLTIFFRISSLHAYHVVSTPFVRYLLLSLQLDTSKTSTSLGSFALSTLIPHIPNWIANGGAGGLPALLSILARIIDWRRLGPQWEERKDALTGEDGEEAEEWSQVQRISRRLNVAPEIQWRRLDTSFDTIQPPPPNAERLFTFLYGIFPCNVIRFLRAPIDYLRKAEYESPFIDDWDDIIDEVAVQSKSAPILRRHILHPSLVTMNAESEITDKQRWREHDAADITAECVCLHIGGQVLDEMSVWPESRRTSLADHSTHRLAYRSASGSVSSVTSPTNMADYAIASGLVGPLSGARRDDLASDVLSHQMTPSRTFRKRTLSENLGRRGSIDASFVEPQNLFASPALKRRELSAQPRTSLLTSPRIMPFTLQSTLLGGEADALLQNHVRLRYASPSGGNLPYSSAMAGGIGTHALFGDGTPGTALPQDPLSRSSSIRSNLKAFDASKANQNLTNNTHQAALQAGLSGTSQPHNAMERGVASDTSSAQVRNDATAPSTRSNSVTARDFAADQIGSPHSLSNPSPLRMAPFLAQTVQQGVAPTDLDAPQQYKIRLREEVRQTIAYLKQENLQLRNELNYEIGQKDQMLRHIGRIHRDRMRDTVLEDERQNLYQTVRTLRVQLKSLRATQDRSKTEAVASKSRHANWENELNAKLKSFREEKKVWANEVRQLQIVKEDNESLIAKLEEQLHENANEVFELREQCKRDTKKIEAIREYEEKIRRLEECLTLWDEDMLKFNEQRRMIDKMQNEYEEMSILFDSLELDLREAQKRTSAATREKEALEREVTAYRQDSEQQLRRREGGTGSEAGVQSVITLGRTREDEEKTRLRARIERLEAELLDAKARQEEWQMEELYRRLQSQQREGVDEHAAIPSLGSSPATAAPDHDVAPLDLSG